MKHYGLCVPTCPTEAVFLNAKDDPVEPPKDLEAMMAKLVEERGLN
jgi:hypothetical protein